MCKNGYKYIVENKKQNDSLQENREKYFFFYPQEFPLHSYVVSNGILSPFSLSLF